MKRLLLILVLISSDLMSMHCNTRLTKKVEHNNMQLCWNTPRDFGTKHFIVGYKEQGSPAKQVDDVKVKKQSKRGAHKKRETFRGGAELIDKNCKMQSFFTSIHDLSDILTSVISEAQKNLCIAAFTLTDPRVANLVIEKHKNGVKVCIIVDGGYTKQSHSKVHNLIENNVAVWRYNPALNLECKKNGLFEPLMHHKFITIDDNIVVTGSANLTKAAHKYNRENIIVIRDMQLTNEYHAECERLKKYCTQCKSHNAE